MKKEEACRRIDNLDYYMQHYTSPDYGERDHEAMMMAKKALEQEPCCNCIEFKRYAKQMGFKIETQPIPYLMHKEMDIPLLECQKAYDVAIEYLRSQGKLKG